MGPYGYDYAVIAMAFEAVLERKRREKTLMAESLNADRIALQEKARELTLLTREKQSMVAEIAPKEKFVANFMGFLDAIDKGGDPQITQKFDEKEMMSDVSSMLKTDGGDNDVVSKIILNLQGKAKVVDAITATINSGCSFGGHEEGIGNSPKTAEDLGEETGTPVNVAVSVIET